MINVYEVILSLAFYISTSILLYKYMNFNMKILTFYPIILLLNSLILETDEIYNYIMRNINRTSLIFFISLTMYYVVSEIIDRGGEHD